MKTVAKTCYILSILSVVVCFIGLFAVNHSQTSLALCIPAGICGMMAFGAIGMIFDDLVSAQSMP